VSINISSVNAVVYHLISRDIRILCQKIANSAQHFNLFFYGKIVCDRGVLSRVSCLVGRLKLRVTIQLTLSLRLLTRALLPPRIADRTLFTSAHVEYLAAVIFYLLA